MSKYPFYDRVGRPSKAESKLCNKIKEMITTGEIRQSSIDKYTKSNGVPRDMDGLIDMYEGVTGFKLNGQPVTAQAKTPPPNPQNPPPQPVQDDFSDDDFTEDADFSDVSTQGASPINQAGAQFDPFADPVIERAYTGTFVASETSETEDDGEDAINNTQQRSGVSLDDDDFQDPDGKGGGLGDYEDDIPEPDYVNSQIHDPYATDGEDGMEGEGGEEDYSGGEKLGGDNLQDMSPAQKRKAAEKTADAILQMYSKFAPLPFKKWASISENKLQKLAFEDRIDLNMEIEEDITVKQYADGVNEQVDKIFTVDDETIAEIKDPLVDVLMEQELALTPTQRLLMAVGSHVVQMGFSAYSLAQNNKVALETFQRFHEENKRLKAPAPSQPTRAARTTYSDQPISQADRSVVDEFLKEVNDGEQIIDPDHDPTITVEDSMDD
jgi:hypothetical protein